VAEEWQTAVLDKLAQLNTQCGGGASCAVRSLPFAFARAVFLARCSVHLSSPTFSTAVLTCVHAPPPPPSTLRWLVYFVAVIVWHQAAFLARHPLLIALLICMFCSPFCIHPQAAFLAHPDFLPALFRLMEVGDPAVATQAARWVTGRGGGGVE
jgi:hypothetical protein